jgi:hypothetical protein
MLFSFEDLEMGMLTHNFLLFEEILSHDFDAGYRRKLVYNLGEILQHKVPTQVRIAFSKLHSLMTMAPTHIY